jgi:uncharacterized RDD family membrane protein YckC
MRKQPVDLPGLEPASFLKRLLALIVDALLITAVTRAWMLFGFGVFSGNVLGVLLLVSMLLRFLYFPICHGLWGRTAGKRLMGIRLVRGSGEPMSLWPGFLREIFYWPGAALSLTALISLWTRLDEQGSFREYQRMLSSFYFENFRTLTSALLLGGVVLDTMSLLFFWMNPDRRIPHDYVADTYVCQDKKSES